MLQRVFTCSFLALALTLASPLAAQSIAFGRFGTLPLHRPSGPPRELVLLLAEAPRSPSVTRLAAALSASGAVVAVVNQAKYRAAVGPSQAFCAYPSADLEELGRFLTSRLGLANLPPPILAADRSAGGLAYAALAQSPPGTFSGLLTVGFCPLYSFPRPLCGGNSLRTDWSWQKSGVRLRPESGLGDPWVALETPEPACEAGALKDFASPIKRAVILPAVSAPPAASSEPAADPLRGAFARLVSLHEERQKERAAEAREDPLADLPLVELPVEKPAGSPATPATLAVMLSGDGGWVGLDQRLGNRLSKGGVPVVGLSSLNYFWKKRTPESTTADLVRILDHYLAAWHAESALLIGYSQGADVLPFLVDRLPERLLAKVSAVALIGPDTEALFDFQFGNFMAGRSQAPGLPVQPQLASLKARKVLCVFASAETDSLCRKLRPGTIELVSMPGGHGYSRATEPLADRLLAEAGVAPTTPAPVPPKPANSPTSPAPPAQEEPGAQGTEGPGGASPRGLRPLP
ncbi:MAG TPA: AcvB/VirJ family lysyl-phosphatidylglycerol hydrolase [Thermoanaerobaculia bacterium]|nr:AcvB/VirJ family lysyl-phosphatidylglycerol hydrolase [Thermoanaerobaculia bacterium]